MKMKNHLLFALLLSLSVSIPLFAQTIVPQTPTPVLEGDYSFVKKIKATGHGLAMDVAGEEEVITEMMSQRLEEASGEKVKSIKKDIMGIEGVVLEAISANTFDYYFKVEKLKSEIPRSRVTFFVSVGNYNFINSEKYPNEVEASKVWLQKLLVWKRLKEIAVEEAAQQTKLMEAQKKQEALLEKEKGMLEEKLKLEDEIAKLLAKVQELEKKKISNAEALKKHEVSKTAQAKNVEEIKDQLQQLLNEKLKIQQ